MVALTEKEISEPLATRVSLPVTDINYRVLEESLKGINKEIKEQVFDYKKKHLFRIREDIQKILAGL